MKKKTYQTPQMKQYDIEPMQLLAGSGNDDWAPGTGAPGHEGGYE